MNKLLSSNSQDGRMGDGIGAMDIDEGLPPIIDQSTAIIGQGD
jgi:hypothetical protein